MKTIYVVGFSPRDGGVGGFDWYETAGEAARRMIEHMTEDARLSCDYKLRVTAVSDMSRDEITEWLDSEGLDLWDTALPDGSHAAVSS